MIDRLLLVGPASVDRYVATGEHLPGGGALNMAYHWSQLGLAHRLVSRVSEQDRGLFVPFLERNGIAATDALFVPGASCSVDITIRPDRQPWMDRFVEGVWSDFSFTGAEVEEIRAGAFTHLVLVDVVDRAIHDLAPDSSARLSGDFLSFRHFTPERFAGTFALLELGFVGWPGDPGDPVVEDLGSVAGRFGNVLVVTFGDQGVAIYDGRGGQVRRDWYPVDARPVLGTTVGCGDAFIAAFTAEWVRDADLGACVEAGRRLGAAATEWMRPLPDDAYP